MKDEFFDTIHQEGFGKDFESEYPDILHDESFGSKDSKIGPTLALKEMREKEKKTRCQDTYFEKNTLQEQLQRELWHRGPRKWIDSYSEGNTTKREG